MGRHTPDYSTLNRITVVIRLPVAYFYAEDDELAELIKIFSKLKKDKRTVLIKQINTLDSL